MIEGIINIIVYLALKAGGLSYVKLQGLILTLRSRHIHKCDLSNLCNTLEIHTELIPLKGDGGSRVEHYGKYFDEKSNLGLVKGHYFINDYTQLTSYCLENYEEVKDINDNKLDKKYNDKYKKCNGRLLKHFKYLRC